VGIREDQETVSRMQPTEVPTSLDGGLPPLIEHCMMPATDSSLVSVSSSQPAAEVAAWVDTTTPAYSVVRCTPGFSVLCGPTAEGTEFQEWINGKKQRKRFREWVQEAFNAFYHGCDMPAEKLKMEVTLTPPHLKRLKMNVTTIVEKQRLRWSVRMMMMMTPASTSSCNSHFHAFLGLRGMQVHTGGAGMAAMSECRREFSCSVAHRSGRCCLVAKQRGKSNATKAAKEQTQETNE